MTRDLPYAHGVAGVSFSVHAGSVSDLGALPRGARWGPQEPIGVDGQTLWEEVHMLYIWWLGTKGCAPPKGPGVVRGGLNPPEGKTG